jgi:ankyrin repeat protein
MNRALFKAIKHGDVIKVRHLLAAGADPNEGFPRSFTPLTLAAAVGHTPIVALLLEHGAKSCLNPAYPHRQWAISSHLGQHRQNVTRRECRMKLLDFLENFGGRGWNRTIDPPRVKKSG